MPHKSGRSPKISSRILIKDYVEGSRMAFIASRHGLSTETVRLHLIAEGKDVYDLYKKAHKAASLNRAEKKFMEITASLGRIPLKGEVREYGLQGTYMLFN